MATIKDLVTAAVTKVADEVKKKKESSASSAGNSASVGGSSAPASNAGMSSYVKSDSSRGTSTNYGTYKEDLDRVTAAQRQAQVDQLKAARKKALANLDVQEQNIKPMYQTARNQTAAASQQGARSFAEYLANRGLTNSGAAAQGEINRLSALNNNLGNLNTAEANAYRDIANQRTAVENEYVAGLANANNAITNNYYNSLLNYNEQQRQMVQALQQQALGQYANDYAAYRNQLLAQGYDPNSLEVLNVDALRGNKMANQYQLGLQNALANVQAGNINYNNAAALGMTIPQAEQWSANYQKSLAEQAQLEAAERQRKIDQQNWENDMAYNNYLLNAQKTENDTRQTEAAIRNINSQINKRNSTPSTSPSKTPDGQLAFKEIDSMVNDMPTTEKRKEYLDGLLATAIDEYGNRAISDADYKKLYYKYQIPI